jgi:hypothetical protein
MISFRSPRFHTENRVPARFKSALSVVADAFANEFYGLDSEKLKKKAERARESHPRLSKAVGLATKYCYWVGLSFAGRELSRHIGPEIGYSLAFTHPFLLRTAVQYGRHKAEKRKERFSLLSQFKPDIPTFEAIFNLTEQMTIPIYIATANAVVNLAGKVSAGLAIGSVAAATVVSYAVDYLCFRHLWKRRVLKDSPQGTFADEAKGFAKEFASHRIFSNKSGSNPAKTASEYVGQIWGVIESHMLWLQAGFAAIAAATAAFFDFSPKEFVAALYLNAALWGHELAESIISAKIYISMADKFRENNKHLGLDK